MPEMLARAIRTDGSYPDLTGIGGAFAPDRGLWWGAEGGRLHLCPRLWISDIWFNVVPMSIAGAGCGACTAWAYGTSVERPSWSRWIGDSLLSAALLLVIGGVALAMFEPRSAIAEVVDDQAALGSVLGRALPLIVVGNFGNSLVMFASARRSSASLLPTGHNLAVLGLVDIPADQWTRVGVLRMADPRSGRLATPRA